MGASTDGSETLAGPGQTRGLPVPTGPCPVGTISLWLTDASRPDPWATGVSARELMVSLWYPATSPDGRRAPYMTRAESELQLASNGLSRPFMFLGKAANYTPGKGGDIPSGTREWKLLRGSVTTWEHDWALLTGWKRWLLVAGAVHASFTDLALLADQNGIDTGAALTGARSLNISRAYVRAFFDQHLRGRPQMLLDQPSPRYPEVTFALPEADPRA